MKQISRTTANADYQKPTTEQIAVAAFHLYLENGCQDGHDLDDWLRAEDLLTQKLKTVAKVEVFGPNRKDVSRKLEIHPAAARGHPSARDERGSASREEIRQRTIQYRPASRQLQ
jgi:hypothetical protein